MHEWGLSIVLRMSGLRLEFRPSIGSVRPCQYGLGIVDEWPGDTSLRLGVRRSPRPSIIPRRLIWRDWLACSGVKMNGHMTYSRALPVVLTVLLVFFPQKHMLRRGTRSMDPCPSLRQYHDR